MISAPRIRQGCSTSRPPPQQPRAETLVATASSRSVIQRHPITPLLLYSIQWTPMASLLEAIEIKRKMFFEFEDAPYHCLDVEVSKPTARGGQTLVRLKMRNLLTRAVFDRSFKAGEKFKEPDLIVIPATYSYADSDGYHFLDQETFETVTLGSDALGD